MAEIEGGYILVSRKLIESEIWEKPPIYLKVWLYILSKAQHRPYKNLDRGELIVSIPELIEVCSYKVGYRTERPSKTQIYNVLEWLRNSDEGANEGRTSDTMITTTKTTRGMVVKVHNYNVYQDPKNYERNGVRNDEETTNGTMPERQADTINKNDKNVKNDKKKDSVHQDELFEQWWELYANKKGRAKCITKYRSLLKKYTHEQMMTGTEKYIQHRKDLLAKNEFCPQQKNPLTFLNGEHFNDEYESSQSTAPPVYKEWSGDY